MGRGTVIQVREVMVARVRMAAAEVVRSRVLEIVWG